MLSRVAERVYWSARYLERVEDTARLILVRHNLMLDMPRSVQPDWELLLEVLGAEQGFASRPGVAHEQNLINYVFSDRENSPSLLSSLAAARENIRTTREVLPSECWERINSLYLSVARRASKGLPRASRHVALNNIILACQQITGMLAGTMNHDESYQFVRMGRYLERADMSTRIIDVGTADLMGADEETAPYQNMLWMSVLQSLGAYQMYRLSVGANVQPAGVVDFLMRNKAFPRSAAHCLQVIGGSMQMLPQHDAAQKTLHSVQRKLRRTDCGALPSQALHQFIDDYQLRLHDIHQAISTAWFTPER